MKKFLPLLFIAAACAPDITQNPAPGGAIIAQFDPGNVAVAIVPAPNDLALTTGKVVVPVPHGCNDFTDPANPKLVPAPNAPATAANKVKDGDETDVDCGGTSTNACDAGKACAIAEDCASGICTNNACVGGCPSAAQQELNTRYLGTLSGFPFESTASCSFSAELSPASVSALSVLGIDITDPKNPVSLTTLQPSYGNKQIIIAPPTGGWTRGHKYAMVIHGGAVGVKGPNGEAVIGSQTWALVSSKNPLVTCPTNLADPNCQPTVDIIPSQQQDPGARLAEQTATAKQLEQIRQGYDQILTAVEAKGIPRAEVPLLWTFTIVDAGEVTFNPANNVIPFPNDILLDPTSKKVALPNPKTFKPLTAADCAAPTDQQVALVCGLNTLDGFSTLVPPVSENSATDGAVQQANIDATSLNTQTVGLVPLKATFPGESTKPQFTPCLNCASSKDATGKPQTSPQELQWSLQAPLDENTQYLAYVTTAVKDDKGKGTIANPVFALLRSTQPLVDAAKKSTVSLITDDQAQQLEPLRAALKPAFDGLETAGVKREVLNLAFAFTTQSEGLTLDKLKGLPTQAGALGLPDAPVAFTDVSTFYHGAATAAGISNIDPGVKFFAGVMLSPELVTGTGGTFNPDPSKSKVVPVPFVVAVPKPPYPATGFPVTILGHGFTRSRNDFLPIAGALTAANQIVIATDLLFHGERTSCTGSKAVTAAALPAGVTPSDDFACKLPAAGGGNMTCDEDPLEGQCILTGGTRDACVYGKFDATGDGGCGAKGQGRCAADNKCQGVAAAPTACAPGDLGNASCLSQGLGVCSTATSVCTGSSATLARDATGLPKITGWNYYNLVNYFATRDNFRQQVIDLSQLMRVLKSTATTPIPSLGADLQGLLASATPVMDNTKVNYVGQSQGGIDGALFNAVSPDTNNVVLNVAGGAIIAKLFTESPSLATQRKAVFDALAAQGVTPGTPTFDQFIGFVQWILDPADPANVGYRLTHPVDTGAGSAPNANRKVFLQFIENDQFVVNDANFALVAAANRTFAPTPPKFGCVAPLSCYEFTEAGDTFDTTSLPLTSRHGFLLNFANIPVTAKAQTQVATFIATGVGP